MLPVEGELRQEEVDIVAQQRPITCPNVNLYFVSATAELPKHSQHPVLVGSVCIPRRPSPDTPLVKLSNQFIFACASFTATGCPSCSTLCTVIKALNVCTSSARMGCTFMPAQKDCEDLWSQVYTMHARTCLRFGAVSSKQEVSTASSPRRSTDLCWSPCGY